MPLQGTYHEYLAMVPEHQQQRVLVRSTRSRERCQMVHQLCSRGCPSQLAPRRRLPADGACIVGGLSTAVRAQSDETVFRHAMASAMQHVHSYDTS